MNLTVEMLLPLAGILIGAKLAANASQHLGLPAVFGELMLGLLIGPSLLNWIHPNEALHLLADIGVILLMFMAGLETDVKEMRQVGRTSMLTAIGGVVLPLAGGTALGLAFEMPLNQALFLGAVLTATSVSISAQTLREMGRLRSKQGITIMSAAIIDDILGVLIFAVVMSLAGEGNLVLTLTRVVLFFPIAWLIGDRLLPWLIRYLEKKGHPESSLAVFVGLLLAYAWSAEVFGSVATITGAYLLGVLTARHTGEEAPETHKIIHSGTSALGYGFLIPIFFVNIGLQSQTTGLFASPLLTVTLALFAVASKIIGCGAGALAGGLGRQQALQVGISMVSRGEVALVIAGAGLAAGLLDAGSFSILIFVTLLTTLITPPLLRLSFASRASAYGRSNVQRTPAIPDWVDYPEETRSVASD